ncbi:hypothetical protein UY3_05863 [Chelonia mydas]|uniref:Uncharacterized protein n=1 Tax=Chelonia mydas TaxID=8469 RepID=M7BGC8_CHEMY|nr:hypothetical protein UY3_05863 [Chelonia mydas]
MDPAQLYTVVSVASTSRISLWYLQSLARSRHVEQCDAMQIAVQEAMEWSNLHTQAGLLTWWNAASGPGKQAQTALLCVPGIAFVPHVLCDFGIDVSISSAGSELCTDSSPHPAIRSSVFWSAFAAPGRHD